ncbi:universal stress protein [Halegenticoccus soli]|uniref:universal stress protein n=1 Tax=Halegenticoccus soli TaxID=1985678 RepID=UPI000C6D254D|nr:universal stress protein [Halegenticoccus soli]
MYDDILFPTDGSAGTTIALRQCLSQAEIAGATVHALYVVDVRTYGALPEEMQEQVARALQRAGADAVDRIAERAEALGVEVKGEVRHGIPHEEILSYADESGVDLIVMGTHGRSGEAHRILGSVAEEVVRNARVPVLTVRMSESAVDALEEDVPEEQRRYIT